MNSNTPHQAATPPQWARHGCDFLGLLTFVGIALIAVRGITIEPEGQITAAGFESGSGDLCRGHDDGYLAGSLYGAVERTIDWRGTEMECNGNARPDNAGIRLVFAAPNEADVDRLVFVIGIDGAIDELTAGERSANITIIDETSGRFFSTGGKERCWTIVDLVEPIAGNPGQSTVRATRVDGEFFCTGSLPSLSDTGSVSLRGFRYSGRLTLDAL